MTDLRERKHLVSIVRKNTEVPDHLREHPIEHLGAIRQTSARSAIWLLTVLVLAAGVLETLTPPPAFGQERAWVRREVRLNLRSGPGNQYRIKGVVATNDELGVLERVEGWTKVRLADGTDGWILEGYLKPEPPPTIRLVQLESETEQLRGQLSTNTDEAGRLRKENETLAEKDGLQRAEIERLIFDNTKLRAGARYPELIAGASILAAGMILGAMLHRSSSNRRPASRIRL
ncbi:MAG: SH3 domain protein [Myxococcota bacterium]|jgi:SH3 domain protein